MDISWRSAFRRPLSAEGAALLLVLLVSLLAAWRLRGPGLVASADGLLHLYRVFALDRALQQGILFPRVLPDLLFGYGYPLFNFYPPAATYFVELLHLAGLDFLAALRVAYGATFALAGLAMYAFARAAFSIAARSGDGYDTPPADLGRRRAAALVAAAAYVLAPYFLINVYIRGALAEALAVALFPALLVAAQRLVERPGSGTLLGAVLLTALLVLTHSALAVFFLPAMVAHGLLVARLSPRPRAGSVQRIAETNRTPANCHAEPQRSISWPTTRRLLHSVQDRLFAAAQGDSGRFLQSIVHYSRAHHAPARALGSLLALLVLGLGLSAFFWLPAALERGYVNAQNIETGFYDVHRNFLDWSALVQPELFYPTADPLPIPPRLGLLQALLGGLALPLLRRGPLPRPLLAFWVAGALTGLFLITPASAPLWERLPLIAGLSFPWRLLGGVGLATALLTGALVLALRSPLALPGAFLLVAASAAVALPALTPPRHSIAEQDIRLDRYWRFEFETSMVGTTSANEYLPRALRAGSYALPRVPDEAYQARAAAPPSAAEVRLLDFTAQGMRLRVAGNRGTSIAAHAVYFPGWRATVDGSPVATYPGASLGLVTVDVPPGEHDLTLDYGGSDVAAAAGLISLASLVAVAALLLAPLRAGLFRSPVRSGSLAVAVVVLLLALLRPLAPAEPSRALQRPDGATGRLSDDLELLGWRPPAGRDGFLEFSLYWLARRDPTQNEVVAVTLRDAQGGLRTRWERHPQDGYSPTLRWVAGEIVPDAYALALPPDVAPGEYTVEIGLRGSPRVVALGRARLAGSTPPPVLPPPAPRHPLDLRAGDGMRLLGYDIDSKPRAGPAVDRPGRDLVVTLYWQDTAVLDRDYTVFLHLLDDRGERRAQHDAQPRDGRRPTLLWQPGEVIVDRHPLALPADLPPGRYHLLLGAYFRPTMARLDIFDSAGQKVGDYVGIEIPDGYLP